MIYDEITMYPCESWMVLVAIIVHRWDNSRTVVNLFIHSTCQGL
jgi:hypothetical protein